LEVADAETFAHARTLALDEVDRMGRLVDSLVTLAQADGPGFVDLAPVDLAPLVDDVLDKARVLGPREWRIDERCEVQVRGDSQRLTQALLQLASNAVRYSGEGSVVAFGVGVRDGEAWLTVRDEGRGIAPSDRERIFERFGRGAGTGRIEGSGLGLAIVAAIADAHGGRVEVDSTLGKGSVFAIVLPGARTGGYET
jgi:signal transduction histidine kinase